jgi:methylenetetrahydrofolate dehydrogenase (NADP+) / methenyltetrahydrofolate cyclohydrolase
LFCKRSPDSIRLEPFVANIAQLVEHVHGKDEVIGSIPIVGSLLPLMTQILDGKKLSDKLAPALARAIGALKAKPRLVIIQVGDIEESNTYIARKKAFGEKLGALVERKKYPTTVFQNRVIADIKRFNADRHVHGVMVQLPIPAHLDTRKILDTIDPDKDVDGLTSTSVKRLFDNQEIFLPATAKGILTLLEHYGVPLKGKKVVIVGESILIGRPTALIALNRGATVTVCHRETKNLKSEAKQAHILIVGTGQPKLITPSHVNKDQIVLDVGFSVTKDKKVVGDVDYNRVSKIVKAISPVPGGVGPMTVYSLFENLLEAYKMNGGKQK